MSSLCRRKSQQVLCSRISDSDRHLQTNEQTTQNSQNAYDGQIKWLYSVSKSNYTLHDGCCLSTRTYDQETCMHLSKGVVTSNSCQVMIKSDLLSKQRNFRSIGVGPLKLHRKWGLFNKMATDWEVSEVGDTCRPAADQWKSSEFPAGTAHLGFPELWSVPHLLSREIKMNRRH